MDSKYIVIRDMSAGNDTVGEMWKETKIFYASDTVEEVMKWATNNDAGPSRKNIVITRAHN